MKDEYTMKEIIIKARNNQNCQKKIT